MTEQTLEKQKLKPCIYGANILAMCPVRGELSNTDPMRKYKMPKTAILDDAKDLMDMAQETLGGNMEMRTLVDFCTECPHVALWYEEQARSRFLQKKKGGKK